MKHQKLLRDDSGAAIVEIAFALPAFVLMLWSMVQLGLIYRANSGIQHALGQGARYATLYPTPTDVNIKAQMDAAVYGIGPGDFTPVVTDVPDQGYKDLKVTYVQKTDFLLFPGPTINVTKSKRVWVASVGSSDDDETPPPPPATQTCPDGSVISATDSCPPPSPQPPGPTPTPATPDPTPTPPTPDPTPTPTPPVCLKKNGKPC